MNSGPDKVFGKWGRVILALLLAAALAACTTSGGKKAQKTGQGPVDQLVLVTAPAAVDSEPPVGPDAIAVKVYAMSGTKPKAISISRGALEVYLFDGVLSSETPENVKPLKVWSRSANELQQFGTKTAIGVSYAMTLLWGKDKPKQENVTIIARYIDPSGRSIYSSPSTIPVGQ